VRGEPVVDLDLALVRDHVAGHTTRDANGVQPLPVRATVDRDLAWLVRLELAQDGTGGVDGVDPHPGAGRGGTPPDRGDPGPNGALTARLHQPVRGFEQDREVGFG